MSPEQCRAARAWLEWTQQTLAQRAGVGLSTVKDFEKGNRDPIANNRNAIKKAFEDVGLTPVFGKDGAPTGILVEPLPTQKKEPPGGDGPRRPGPKGRKVASPRSRASG